ncbi:MAG: hypothetical protein HY737_06920 [Candidatus Omnitrophica bacterium]|nr:hypothetical protein [Candidatus Omnitrophota bacterium]
MSRRSDRRTARRRRGVFLVGSLLLMTGIAGLIAIVQTRALGEVRLSQQAASMQQAAELAEAGIDQAFATLLQDPYEAPLPYDCPADPLPGGGMSTCRMTDGGGMLRQITATGSAHGVQQAMEVMVEMVDSPLFRWAAFGEESVEFDAGGLVDSYDSSLGMPYAPCDPDPGPCPAEASVQTNNSNDAAIRQTGDVDEPLELFGDATIGPGGSPSSGIAIGPNSTIYGQRREAPYPVKLPAITPPAGSVAGTPYTACAGGTNFESLNIDSGWDISRLTIPSNCFVWVTGIPIDAVVHLDEIHMASDAQLAFSGGDSVTVVIDKLDMETNAIIANSTTNTRLAMYVREDLEIRDGAGFANGSRAPDKFALYVEGEQEFDLRGATWWGSPQHFYGVVYAPESDVTLDAEGFGSGNPDPNEFFGSFVAKELEFHGRIEGTINKPIRVHYDRNLLNQDGALVPAIRYWGIKPPQDP